MAAVTSHPTAPLPPAALAAMARLEKAFATPTRTAVPTLGRLTVERRSTLGASEATLDKVPVGNGVTATATIAGLRTFSGRVRLVLDDGQGGSANVVVDSSKVVAAFRGAGTPPRIGARVQLHGVVTPPFANMPKGIEANALRVVA
ncbi:hypothetical protein ACWEP4_42950 [Streptomyces sp. NPDC004227]